MAHYKKDYGQISVGIMIILIGIIMLFNRVFDFKVFSIAKLWPFFLIIPGLFMHLDFFGGKNDSGALVGGGILTFLGLFFLFNTLTNWRYNGRLWPMYILAIAVGLLDKYVFAGRDKSLLVPITILTMLSIVFLVEANYSGLTKFLFPICLIVLGLIVLIKDKK